MKGIEKITGFSGVVGKGITAKIAGGIDRIPWRGGTSLGESARKQEEGFRHAGEAEHTLDAKVKEMGHFGDAKYKDLSEPEKKEVKEEVDKDQLAKQEYGGKYAGLKDENKRDIKDRVEKGEKARKNTGDELEDLYGKGKAVGEFVQALRKGTYDVRNLSLAQGKAPGISKFAVGLLATTTAVMRAGFKGIGVQVGTSQKDFIKDLGAVITDSLKNVKIDAGDVVKAATGQGGGGHGGGGGHH